MTLNGVMAVILRYFSEFGYLPGALRRSSRSLSHLLMSSCLCRPRFYASFYAVARPCVCRLSVCRLSVSFVRPTQPVEIFGNFFTLFGTLVIR